MTLLIYGFPLAFPRQRRVLYRRAEARGQRNRNRGVVYVFGGRRVRLQYDSVMHIIILQHKHSITITIRVYTRIRGDIRMF